jgi:hypothetical protein
VLVSRRRPGRRAAAGALQERREGGKTGEHEFGPGAVVDVLPVSAARARKASRA